MRPAASARSGRSTNSVRGRGKCRYVALSSSRNKGARSASCSSGRLGHMNASDVTISSSYDRAMLLLGRARPTCGQTPPTVSAAQRSASAGGIGPKRHHLEPTPGKPAEATLPFIPAKTQTGFSFQAVGYPGHLYKREHSGPVSSASTRRPNNHGQAHLCFLGGTRFAHGMWQRCQESHYKRNFIKPLDNVDNDFIRQLRGRLGNDTVQGCARYCRRRDRP